MTRAEAFAEQDRLTAEMPPRFNSDFKIQPVLVCVAEVEEQGFELRANPEYGEHDSTKGCIAWLTCVKGGAIQFAPMATIRGFHSHFPIDACPFCKGDISKPLSMETP